MLNCSSLFSKIKLKTKLMASNKAGATSSSSASAVSRNNGVVKPKKGWTTTRKLKAAASTSTTTTSSTAISSTLSNSSTCNGNGNGAPYTPHVNANLPNSTICPPPHSRLPLPLHSVLTTNLIPHTLPSHPAHVHSSTPFNSRTPHKPLVITYPSTTSQIQALVRVSAELGLKISVRSGGHSYGAYGLGGGRDGAVVVDLRAWQDVKLLPNEAAIDQKEDVVLVKAGGGTRLGNLAGGIYKAGRRGMPHGTCPLVGLGGHALYGGFGLSSRMWGLALDQIVKLEGVLADGSTFVASAKENRELFWALRGAGPSFAIVTSFTLKTYPAPRINIVYEFIWWFPMKRSPATGGNYPATQAYLLAQKFGLTSPLAVKQLGMGIRMEKGGFFRIYGVYYGNRQGFEDVTRDLVRGVDEIWERAVGYHEWEAKSSTTSEVVGAGEYENSTVGNHDEGVRGGLLGKGRERIVRELGYLESLQLLAEGQSLENNVVVPSYEDLQGVLTNTTASPSSSPHSSTSSGPDSDSDSVAPEPEPKLDYTSLGPGMEDTFLAKSIIQESTTLFPARTLNSLFTYLYTHGEVTPVNWFIISNLYGGGRDHSTSEITNKPPPLHPNSTSSYPHRDCGFVWQFYGSAKGGCEGLSSSTPSDLSPDCSDALNLIPFMNNMVTSITSTFGNKPEESWTSYAPYIDPTLVGNRTDTEADIERRKAALRYFDHEGSLRKLEELKRRWDGRDLFWCEVGVEPASGVRSRGGGL